MSISALGIGSGLELNGLLEQMESAERQRLEPIARQQQSYQSQISAYGKLESALSSFQDAVQGLNDPSLYQAATASVSGDAVTASVDANAAPGTYSISAGPLAQAYSVATESVADKDADLGGGTVDIELANGESMSAQLKPGESSLEDVRDAINAEDGGVHASVINDGQGYRLALASETSGEDAAIANIGFGGTLGGELTIDWNTEKAAQNASMTINNIDIESQTNQFEGVLEGVTLSLAEAGEATLRVEKDHAAIKDAVNEFVSAHNEVQQRMRNLGDYDAESGQGGALLGDSTLRTVQSEVRAAVTSAGESDVAVLSDLGIRAQLDGTLKVDESTLDAVVESDPTAVSEFFVGTQASSGLAGRVDGALDRFLGPNGMLDTATSGLETSIDRLDDRAQRMEQNISRTIERYRSQFTQLDSMIADMQSTSTYLDQQFAGMNAQLG